MKKLLIALTALLFSCRIAQALPLGDPSEASIYKNGICWENECCDFCDPCFSWFDAWSLRFGFYGDYVFNRHMEVEGSPGDDIKDFELYTNSAYLVFNVCDKVDLFATLGETSLEIHTSGRAFNLFDNSWVELVYRPEFSWSLGARWTVWDCAGFSLGIEGQYFQTRPDLDYFITFSNGLVVELDDSSRDHRYHEWQVGLGASYRFATSCPAVALIPYTGVTWSWAKLEMNDFSFLTAGSTIILPDLESKKLWGWALGVTLTLQDMIGVSVEGRWANEKAIHVRGQFRF